MNYLQKNRPRQAFRQKIAILAGIFLALGLLFSFFDNAIISAVSPLWRAQNRFSRALGGTLDFFSTRNSLINENLTLREKVSSLELENASLAVSREENTRLLALLGRNASQTGIAASILTHPPQSPYDLLIIDAGSLAGVTIGSRALLPEGPQLGFVEQVFPRYARIKLFTTVGEKTSAILERHEVPVTLEGSGGGNFRILVPRDTEVVVGDRVISAELDASLLAVVEEVSLEATDSFKEVLAKSPTNIFQVRVIKIEP